MIIQTNIPESVLALSDDFEPEIVEEITDSSRPDIDGLKSQQKEAFDELLAYSRGDREVRYEGGSMQGYLATVLEGYAGTGKTHTLSQLVKAIILKMHKEIAFTAPTNKAVKVLRKSARYKHRLLTYKTIHSLLGLKEDINERTGERKFIPDTDPENQPAIHGVGILIIDEVSMLNNELFKMVYPYIEEAGLKIIFTGDPCQIPPVNDVDCIPFTPRERTRHKIKRLELTEIVRQIEGNPILELATCVRLNINAEVIPFKYKTTLTEQGGIVMISKDDKEALFKVCEHYFTNKRFTHDPDFMKVIAWTNKAVDWMNKKIRTMIYKSEVERLLVGVPDPVTKEPIEVMSWDNEAHRGLAMNILPKMMPGEKLIANTPVMTKDELSKYPRVLFQTNDEFEVKDYTLEVVNVFGNFNVKVYRVNVVSITDSGGEKHSTIDIVHENGEEVYNEVLRILKQRALDERGPEKKSMWRHYFTVKNQFADTKYNYAITAHKSQGSTYDNCIVIDADIDKSQRFTERNRIRYVSYTRARKYLFIVK